VQSVKSVDEKGFGCGNAALSSLRSFAADWFLRFSLNPKGKTFDTEGKIAR